MQCRLGYVMKPSPAPCKSRVSGYLIPLECDKAPCGCVATAMFADALIICVDLWLGVTPDHGG